MSDSPTTVLRVKSTKKGTMLFHLKELLPKEAHFESAGGRLSIDGQGWYILRIAAATDSALTVEVKELLTRNNWEIAQEE